MIEIRNFFEVKIAEFAKANGLRIAGENFDFKPNAQDFLAIHLLPARQFDATLCGKAQSGIFQVTYHGKQNTKTQEADDMCAKIMAAYEGKHGKFYMDNPYRSGGMVVDGRYVVVVSIPYVVY